MASWRRFGMIRLLIWAFLIAFSWNLQAEEQEQDLPLTNTDGDLSGVVNGCVNVISGDFTDYQADLILPSPESIAFTRFYSSHNIYHEGFGHSWVHSFQSNLKISKFKDDKKPHGMAEYQDPYGSTAFYQGRMPDSSNQYQSALKIDPGYKKNKGLTNTGRGIISGRTNLKNTSIFAINPRERFLDPRNSEWRVKTGAGERFDYRLGKYDDYFISKLQKANGNLILFDYGSNHQLKLIRYMNSKESVEFGSLRIIDYGIFKNSTKFEVQASDGRKAYYHFKDFKDDHERRNVYLDYVERSDGPPEWYDYWQMERKHVAAKVKRKRRAEGRFLEVDYYIEGKNRVFDEVIKIKENDQDPKLFRVLELRAPVGTDKTPVPIYNFIYHMNAERKDKEIEILDGSTDVFDAKRHKTTYSYCKNHRLTEISKYKGVGPYQLDHKQKLVWHTAGTDQGNLAGKILEDGNGAPICARVFLYDEFGNVITDRFYGNLSGHGSSLALGNQGLPTENGAESFVKTYEYSKDGMNLIISETEGSFVTTFSYKPGTDLVIRKLIYEGNQVRIREFFEYDDNAVMIKSIRDDGCSSDSSDLTGITERHITLIEPKSIKPGIGLPEKIEEDTTIPFQEKNS